MNKLKIIGIATQTSNNDSQGGFKLLMQRLSKNSKKNDYLIC